MRNYKKKKMRILALIFFIFLFNYCSWASFDTNYPPSNTTTLPLRNQTSFVFNEYINVEFYLETTIIGTTTNTTLRKKSNYYPKIDNFFRMVVNGCKNYLKKKKRLCQKQRRY